MEEPYIWDRSKTAHLDTFVAARAASETGSNVCACTHPPETDYLTSSVPDFVGNDYFCETGTDSSSGVFYSNDPLWDGQDCNSPSTCCQFNSPPFFCKIVSEAATDDLEVRLMSNELHTNEDVPIDIIEIYVQHECQHQLWVHIRSAYVTFNQDMWLALHTLHPRLEESIWISGLVILA